MTFGSRIIMTRDPSAIAAVVVLSAVFGALLAASAPAAASEIEIVVTDRSGTPLEDVRVSLEPSGMTEQHRWQALRSIRYLGNLTDPSGRVVFRDLRPGVYDLLASPPDGFVAPNDNPLEPAPRVTLREGDTRIEIRQRLWRGTPVHAEMSIAEGPYERIRGTLTIESVDSSFAREIPFEDGIGVSRLLVPGRYRVTFEAPTGFLVSRFEVDGVEQRGVSATIDLDETLRETQILIHVRTTATVVGRVTTDDGEPGRVASISTRLVTPGAWAADARAAERPVPARAGGRFVDRDRFEMWMMDGTWEIRAHAEGYEASPEVRIVEVAAGAQASADFELRRVSDSQAGEKGRIGVVVHAPWERLLDDAQVALWRAGDDPLHDRPLAVSKKANHWGRHEFERLAPGGYRVVAWQSRFIEKERLVTIGESEEERRRSIDVYLERGAVVRFEALSEKGEAERDVVVEAQRLDEPPPRVFPLETRHVRGEGGDAPSPVRRAVTDDSGRGEIGGLDAGEFRVRARWRGALARERFVRIREGGRLEESVDVRVGENEILALDLVSLPAASFELTIACDDGFPLPGAASIRVVDFDADVASRREDPELRESVALALDDVTLRGTARETMLVGPLDTGAYHVAVRPESFGAWWWVGADHDRRGAMTVDARAGSTSELGFVPIECAPVLEIPIELPDDTEDFDLRDVTVSAEMRMIDDPEASWVPLDVHVFTTLARAVRLPEARVEIRVRVRHPWLLPDGSSSFEIEVDLERGQLAERVVDADPLGGAVDLRGAAPAYVLTRPEPEPGGERVVTSAIAGGAFVGALVPGRYAVAACVDAACEELGTPRRIDVEPGRTTLLELYRGEESSSTSGTR